MLLPSQRWLWVVLLTVALFRGAAAQSVISGTVSASRSGEAAIGAQILLYADSLRPDSRPFRIAQSNNFGFYSLPNIPAGTYLLFVRALGFAPYRSVVRLDSSSDLRRHIALDDDPVLMEEVTVEGTRDAAVTAPVSRIMVPADILMTAPSFGSEKDVFRVLQLLPGVKSASEISSGLYVRGGAADQNLVLLDGVIVYNPFHLGGFLSSFNPDALLNVQLLKGAFPAQYGGRLSSVIEMTMKEGTKERFTGAGGVGLIASKLTLQGPVIEGMTFMVSGRRMYLDIIQWAAGIADKTPTYYFYDLNAKLNYRISADDRLFLSGYYGDDVLTSPDALGDPVMDISWGNATTNLRWMHVVDASLFTNFSLIYTDFHFNTAIEDRDPQFQDPEFFSRSRIRDAVARGEMQYFAGEGHVVMAGAEVTHHNFQASAAMDILPELTPKQTDVAAVEAALYVQDEWRLSERWNANLGSRLYYFQSGTYLHLEPRLSLAYAVTEDVTASLSYSVGHQYLHLITRNETLLPTDVWFPSTGTVRPSKAWQATAGLSTTFGGEEHFASIEAYYKGMEHLYEYRDGAEFTFGAPLEDQFTSGTGVAYGAELFLQRRIGPLTGWIGYTLSWTRRKFELLNLGRDFYPRYDRRHDISLVLNYTLGERWQLGASWVYGTGQAFTVPEGFYTFESIDGNFSSISSNEYVSRRNNYRAPAYHRLDLNIIHRQKVFGLDSEVSLNIYNAYNRQNPFYILTDKVIQDRPPYNTKTVLKQYSLFPIIPTLGWSFVF